MEFDLYVISIIIMVIYIIVMIFLHYSKVYPFTEFDRLDNLPPKSVGETTLPVKKVIPLTQSNLAARKADASAALAKNAAFYALTNIKLPTNVPVLGQ